MYSVALDVTSCLLPGDGTSSKAVFEPGRVLENLPPQLFTTGHVVVVTISDGSETVEYNLDTFLSKDYRTDCKTIRFGGKQMAIAKLTIKVGFKVIFENIQALTETELD